VASVIPSAPLGTDAARGPYDLGAASGAGPRGDGPERRFGFELAAHPGSPAQARRLTRARLAGWAASEDTCDTAALVISELVTNAVVHTASTVVICELQDGVDIVRIAVRDEGCAPTEPHPCAQRTEEEQGRGLLLVETLCRSWGAQESGTGLLVWAEVPRQAATDEPHGDLGWGARPKPGPAQSDSGEEDEAEGYSRDAGRTEGHGHDTGRGTGQRHGAGPAEGYGRDTGQDTAYGGHDTGRNTVHGGYDTGRNTVHGSHDIVRDTAHGHDTGRNTGYGHGTRPADGYGRVVGQGKGHARDTRWRLG
jgi:anti-sigma regulatory factor (Ser/Thr protein kinase)